VPEGEWAAYAPIAGTPAFLEAVIDDLFSTQPRLKEPAIAVATPGGTGALRTAIDNFLEPGQALLTTSYYWGPYKTLTDEANRSIATFSMFDATGALDVEALDRALREQVKTQGRVLLFLNDPCHNPTGYSMRPAEWKAVVSRLLAHSETAPITLLVDCAYFAYAAGDPRAFLAELAPLLGRVGLLFAWSASKTFTHYGLRVGALVACLADASERALTRAALSYSSRGTWSNCNRGGLAAITRLLVDPELSKAATVERDSLRRMLESRVRAFNLAAPDKNLVYPRYDGGFFVTVFHEHAEAKAAAMKALGVFVVPQPGALRVALCGVAERDVERLVAALAG